MKINMRYISVFFVFFILVNSEEWSCGTKCTANLDENGVLTITGTGAMNNFKSDLIIPWYFHRSSIKSVTIEGITTIGNCAFAGCSSLMTIIIPSSVTTIGESAFYECSSLMTS